MDLCCVLCDVCVCVGICVCDVCVYLYVFVLWICSPAGSVWCIVAMCMLVYYDSLPFITLYL